MMFSIPVVVGSFFCLFMEILWASSVITKGPDSIKVLKSTDIAFLRFEAAEADIEFLLDFRDNPYFLASYLGVLHKTTPQQVADYYQHAGQLPQNADLERAVVASFPFSQFQTFIAVFPWYGTLLSRAHESTIYILENFVTKGVPHVAKSTNVYSQSPPKSTSSLTSVESRTHNGVIKVISPFYSLQIVIPILAGMSL